VVTRRHDHERGHDRVADREHAQGPVADRRVQRRDFARLICRFAGDIHRHLDKLET